MTDEPIKDAEFHDPEADEREWTVESALEAIASCAFIHPMGVTGAQNALAWLKKNLLPQADAKPRSTPGPWRKGKSYSSVVADILPVGAMAGSDSIEAYGGFLIAESIAPGDIPLITAAPMLRDLLVLLDVRERGWYGNVPECSQYFYRDFAKVAIRYGIPLPEESNKEMLYVCLGEALRRAEWK